MSTAENMKVDVTELQNIATQYKEIKENIEICTNRFFRDIIMMCTVDNVIEGSVADHLQTFAGKVKNLLDEELDEVFCDVIKEIGKNNNSFFRSAYTPRINDTDRFMK